MYYTKNLRHIPHDLACMRKCKKTGCLWSKQLGKEIPELKPWELESLRLPFMRMSQNELIESVYQRVKTYIRVDGTQTKKGRKAGQLVYQGYTICSKCFALLHTLSYKTIECFVDRAANEGQCEEKFTVKPRGDSGFRFIKDARVWLEEIYTMCGQPDPAWDSKKKTIGDHAVCHHKTYL